MLQTTRKVVSVVQTPVTKHPIHRMSPGQLVFLNTSIVLLILFLVYNDVSNTIAQHDKYYDVYIIVFFWNLFGSGIFCA
jgi:hypothetical protein